MSAMAKAPVTIGRLLDNRLLNWIDFSNGRLQDGAFRSSIVRKATIFSCSFAPVHLATSL